MGATVVMGPYGVERHHFEEEQTFPVDIRHLVDAYEEAARLAAISAKHAVRTGRLEELRRAQWRECVAQTLEEALGTFVVLEGAESLGRSTKFDQPEPPRFEI